MVGLQGLHVYRDRLRYVEQRDRESWRTIKFGDADIFLVVQRLVVAIGWRDFSA